MARAKRRQPYDPAVHDRRTTDLLRNAQVAAIEVDDPMELGGKLMVMRSTRDDPLAELHARGQIDEAQYQSGRAFQEDFETAERGPRAIDPSKEAVDGGVMPEPITEAQRKAAKQLAVVYRALGQDGAALVHEVLVHGKGRKQIAEARGLSGERWEKYFGMRFRECLDCMALVYGFAMIRG
jgi:nucleotide-binding universal stress UspA family protein